MSRLYVLVRNDLPSMNSGKAMAQVCHAGTQFIQKFGKEKSVKEWMKEADGFGTTIVLGANVKQINELKNNFKIYDIIDPTYPFNCQWELLQYIPKDVKDKIELLVSAYDIPNKYGEVVATRKEYTCSYIFFDDENKINNFREICDKLGIKRY